MAGVILLQQRSCGKSASGKALVFVQMLLWKYEQPFCFRPVHTLSFLCAFLSSLFYRSVGPCRVALFFLELTASCGRATRHWLALLGHAGRWGVAHASCLQADASYVAGLNNVFKFNKKTRLKIKKHKLHWNVSIIWTSTMKRILVQVYVLS